MAIVTTRQYEIHEVSELTGLSPGRLRAWERRYAVVRPERQPNGYRAYNAEQVALLRAFAKLIAGGERIGDLAERPVEDVLARASGRQQGSEPHSALLDAIRALDRDRLEMLVAQQLSLRGLAAFAEGVVKPLSRDVGDLWALGRLPVAAEHLTSEVIVQALKSGLGVARASGPTVLAACLSGERHEWGILATLAVATEAGWRCQYLGPDLPVHQIVEATWTIRPSLVAVSAADAELSRTQMTELCALPGRLPPGVGALAGGSGIAPHARMLSSIGYLVEEQAMERLSKAPTR